MNKRKLKIKDKNGFLTKAGRAAVLATRGELSMAQAANRFGISRRTVGRIFHGQELSSASAGNSSGEVEELKQQVASLTERVAQLVEMSKSLSEQATMRAAAAPQRFRRPLDPHWQQKPKVIGERDYSSYLRDSPGTQVINYFGIGVPLPFSGDHYQVSATPYFEQLYPVSPACTIYPYPQPPDAQAKPAPDAEPVVYADPPTGVVCQCKDCRKWRVALAFEESMLARYPQAAAEQKVFHGQRG